MKHILILIVMSVVLVSSCSEHSDRVKPTENLIILLADGASTSLLSAARWYKTYTAGQPSELYLDPYVCGLIKTYVSDSPIAGSAGAMSCYMTGVPQKSRAISVYPEADPTQDLFPVDTSRTYQPLATLMEAARIDQGKAIGLVATVDFYHATPAACVSHSYNRSGRKEISAQMASNRLDVLFAGGGKMLTGRSREILSRQGITLIEKDVDAFRSIRDGKVWALLADRNFRYEMDREQSEEPSLAEMTAKAIEVLSKDDDGFFLMVEGSLVDMAAHANDPVGTITEFLAFDEAVKVALDFAGQDGNTTVVILSDHGNSGITLGDRRYQDYSEKGLDSIFFHMANYKCSGSRLTEMINEIPVDEIPDVFESNTGITLTKEELKTLIERKGKKAKNYMSVTNSDNLLAAVNSILASHTHIGFVSGNHTGEDVFLAVYRPDGNVPTGVLSNVGLNHYLREVLGLESSLEDLTSRIYVKHTDLLSGYNYSITDGPYPALLISGDNGKVTVPAWEAEIIVDSTRHMISSPSVYIKENDTFYISKDIMSFL